MDSYSYRHNTNDGSVQVFVMADHYKNIEI